MTRTEAIFALIIDVMGQKKVGALLQKFGYDQSPTPELCMQALDENGKAFAVPFGKLARQAARSPKTKEYLLASAKLEKAAGQAGAPGATLTPEQKSEQGLQWFNAIANLIGTGLNSVDDIANATNGTTNTFAQAELQRQERMRQEAQQKTTLYWILGGVGVLLIVVIFVIALTKRQ